MSSATRSWTLIFLISALVAFTGNAVRADIVTTFDTFTNTEGGNPDFVLASGAGGSFADFPINPAVGDPVGSSRKLLVSQANIGESAKLNVGGGIADLTSTSGAQSSWTIEYGINNPLNYNAKVNGGEAFKLTFLSISSNLEFEIKVTSSTGNGTSNANSWQLLNTTSLYVFYKDFSNVANVDFSNIETVELIIRDKSPSLGGSAQLKLVETAAVPEPSAMILSGIAAASFFGLRRRRMAAAAVA